MSKYVISHTGKKGGPWESTDVRIGSSTDSLCDAARATKGGWADVLGAIRVLHPSAKVFRLVRRPSLTTLERAVEAACEWEAAPWGELTVKAIDALRRAVRALRAKRGG